MYKTLINISFFLFHIVLFGQTNEISLDSILGENGLKIHFNWAYPTNTGDLQKLANAGIFQNTGNSASQINLTPSQNFIEFKNDSITGHLSYYGVRQMPGGYGNSDGGINFEGMLRNIKIKINKKGFKKIQLNIDDENNSTESYQAWITLKDEKNVSLSLNSSHRSSINYSGFIVNKVE